MVKEGDKCSLAARPKSLSSLAPSFPSVMPRDSDVNISDDANRGGEDEERSRSATGSVIVTADSQHHAFRVEQNRERLVAFEKQTMHLAAMMNSLDGFHSVQSLDGMAEEFDIVVGEPEDYTIATQSNLPGLSKLFRAQFRSSKRSLYVHALSLNTLSDEYRTGLADSFKILKYFASSRSTTHSSTGQQSYFLRIFNIFHVTSEGRVLVAEDKFPLEYTLQHKLWSNAYTDYHKVSPDTTMLPCYYSDHTYSSSQPSSVKSWAIQLADAIEMLNQAGVVHRFIRPENIVLSSANEHRAFPRLASFDFACLYWDAERRAPVPIRPRGLPFPVACHLLDHLPPECFTDGYNGSMVDVWSLGVLICLLITGNTPFETPDSSTETVPEHITAWKRSEERRLLPEELRSLLDDIFVQADSRICAWEVAKDFRLACKSTQEFTRKNLPQYYRIDLDQVSVVLWRARFLLPLLTFSTSPKHQLRSLLQSPSWFQWALSRRIARLFIKCRSTRSTPKSKMVARPH